MESGFRRKGRAYRTNPSRYPTPQAAVLMVLKPAGPSCLLGDSPADAKPFAYNPVFKPVENNF
jgi:hypothetical protein